MLDRTPRPDTVAVALLTTRLAMSRSVEVRPLGPTAWSSLRLRLTAAGVAPSALIGLGASAMASQLDLPSERAADLAVLLERVGQLSFELERLAARGIWMLSREDAEYPDALVRRIGDQSPPILFGSGESAILSASGIGIVGSRDADASAVKFTTQLADWAVQSGYPVVSGGARGVDATAMRAAFEAGGRAIGVLADSLEQRIRDAETRRALSDGRAVLLSPYGTATPFSVGMAMGRNKVICCRADRVAVVAATKGTGGTWAGAEEALRARWTHVLVRVAGDRDPVAEGLAALGAKKITDQDLVEASASELVAELGVLRAPVARLEEAPAQQAMFGLPISLPVKGAKRSKRRLG